MKISDDRAFELLNCFQEQLELYENILTKSQLQTKLISSGQEKELFELMKEKQSDLDRIEVLSESFKNEKELLGKTPMGEFSSIDSELDHVLLAIEIILKKLIDCEGDDMSKLEKNKNDHQNKMAHLGKGKSLKAYFSGKKKSSMDRSV